jgi:hypothetical protein
MKAARSGKRTPWSRGRQKPATSQISAHRGGVGHAAIDAMIAAVQERFAGYRFRLSSGIEAHHDRVRFSWCAGGTEQAPLFFGGTDFAVLAEDGRLRAVTGFIDAMPSAA